jgi:hypothetical protein
MWFERLYPHIAWREPIAVTLGDVQGYACRLCLALDGLKGTDVHRLLPTPDAVRAHLAAAHRDEDASRAQD